ncbi:hypothetical protein OFN04_33755, partial [Escherichia coli]|nr:hypothetical protein [Escherichia coli]
MNTSNGMQGSLKLTSKSSHSDNNGWKLIANAFIELCMFFEKYNKDSILDNNLSYSDDENSFLSQKVNPI